MKKFNKNLTVTKSKITVAAKKISKPKNVVEYECPEDYEEMDKDLQEKLKEIEKIKQTKKRK